MKRYRYRPWSNRPARGGPGRQYPRGARALMVHARRLGEPPAHKYFPATTVWTISSRPPR